MRIQIIENTRWEYDIINISQGIIYNLSAVDLRWNNEKVRFFLDAAKTMIIEYDGKDFSEITQIDRTKKIDFSDIDDERKPIIKN